MVQTPVRFKKGIAIELRRKGFSYSEIKTSLNIPKSTIAYWLKDIKLSDFQVQKLQTRRSDTAKRNSEKRTAKVLKTIEDIKKSSAKDVDKISKRELWLMGITMYWKNKNKNDLKKGVSFSSSDPDQIKLFLKWLKEVGGIKDDEIMLDIFMGKDKKNSIFQADWFSRVYYYKSRSNFFRIRVKASSMLARQMAGWIEGIRSHL